MSNLLVKNIGLLQTPKGSYSHKGSEQKESVQLKNAAILISEGQIVEITSGGELPHNIPMDTKVLDAGGKLVTPGLVDCHTHMIFGGYRQHELSLKLKGAGYLDILRAGGGIMDTVRETRKADFRELYEKTAGFMDEMASFGVTTCEAKSGYGLNFEDEIKCLEVLAKLREEHPMDLISTFMGAHALPKDYEGRKAEFLQMMMDQVMPYVKQNRLASFVDIFIESGVFSVDEGRPYLEKAVDLGFDIKVHADEIDAIGGSILAGEMGAISAEHLISIDEAGMKSLAKGGAVAVCLPGTSFYLGADFAPARQMIEMGIPVAIATDFNPGSCPSLNLQLAMNLAILKYKMLPEEVLAATTINAASAIGMEQKIGTVEVGKQGDLAIWDVEDLDMICYRFGSNLIRHTVKKGKVIYG